MRSFNPRAPCGARQRCSPHPRIAWSFNPRAPCGARLVRPMTRKEIPFVSIHAPHAGRDSYESDVPPTLLSFNPRAPCGARPCHAVKPKAHTLFQSTRPMRGATSAALRFIRHGRVSIHAPHAGRDRLRATQFEFLYSFQSTRPMRGATRTYASEQASVGFNPRAPCGARQGIDLFGRLTEVSIHAPHAGRDAKYQRTELSI